MKFSEALRARLALRWRETQPTAAPQARPGLPAHEIAPTHEIALSGASFVAQEPALSQELHLTAEDMSGWAMGGCSLSD